MPYTLDSGDRLRVVVFRQNGLSNTYIVDATGKIYMPLIGAVSREDAPPAACEGDRGQAPQRLCARAARGRRARNLSPLLHTWRGGGAGPVPIRAEHDGGTAVAIAGGFTPHAYRYDVEISRSASSVTARQKVPLIAPVRPGDTVIVIERWFYSMMILG